MTPWKLILVLMLIEPVTSYAANECRIQFGYLADQGDSGRSFSAFQRIDMGATVEITRSGVIWMRNLRPHAVRFEVKLPTGVDQLVLLEDERDPRTDGYRNPIALLRATCLPPTARQARARTLLRPAVQSGRVPGIDLQPITGARSTRRLSAVYSVHSTNTTTGVVKDRGGRVAINAFVRVAPSTLCGALRAPGTLGNANRVSPGLSVVLEDYRWGAVASGGRLQEPFSVQLIRGGRVIDERFVSPAQLDRTGRVEFSTPRKQRNVRVHRVGRDARSCWTLDALAVDTRDNGITVRVDAGNRIAESIEANNELSYISP
ncbi:MAG: hypothetical protein GXP15_08125 [Gammaproteobacteria bacterium]|nr:hypothetical protein [Gammaproteobacteria bacterium]